MWWSTAYAVTGGDTTPPGGVDLSTGKDDGSLTEPNRPRALIIDDDIEILDSLRDLLEVDGIFDVELASSLESARAAFDARIPDVALIDVKLGSNDGLTLIPHFRRQHPKAVCVVMTAYPSSEYAVKALRSGADDFIYKPLDPVGLLRTLERALEQRRLVQDKQESERRFHAIFNQSFQLLFILDPTGRVLEVNETALRVGSVEHREVIGRFFWETPWWRCSVGAVAALKRAVSDAADGNSVRQEIDVGFASGASGTLDLSVKPIVDGDGRVVMLIPEARDITDLKLAREELQYLAHHDSLTKLPNRSLLVDRMQLAIAYATRHSRRLALLFVDVDHFKSVNDTLGHRAGDQLLVSISDRLRGVLRAGDSLGRLGGDEFVILLNEIESMAAAQYIASRIVAAIATPFNLIDGRVEISASVGIAVFPDDGDCAETLLTNADIAKRAAKDESRNDYRFFDGNMHAQANYRRRIEVGLRSALAREQLRLHYQPRWNVASGTLIGAEALLRWCHPELGDVPPDQFIPVAEDTGLIMTIGEFVFREACAAAVRWQTGNVGAIPVSVNLSMRQFRDVDLVSKIESILDDSGLDPRLLEIELTEGLLMDDVRRSIAALGELKTLGVRVSIDDFGKGYSSLGHLRRLPVDTVKIDRSFLVDFNSTGIDETIISTIISMARSLDLSVIAEGVETPEQLSLLETLGCHEVQGYLLGRPSPAAHLDAVFAEASSVLRQVREASCPPD